MKTAVAYTSKYGSTKQYAQWLAEEIDADLYDMRRTSVERLDEYDIVIYGGGIYASGILGLGKIKKHWKQWSGKQIILFAVGASIKSDDLIKEIRTRDFADTDREIPFFFCRGDYDFSRLKTGDKILMRLFKKMNENMEKKGTPAPDWEDGMKHVVLGSFQGVDRAYLSELLGCYEGLKAALIKE